MLDTMLSRLTAASTCASMLRFLTCWLCVTAGNAECSLRPNQTCWCSP